jgi:hypothetical protein
MLRNALNFRILRLTLSLKRGISMIRKRIAAATCLSFCWVILYLKKWTNGIQILEYQGFIGTHEEI